MPKNRKTVFKSFSYLQCDDFADYLSGMASQGWHFKEWGAGLVFEKGEPEDAVYAVEVFIHGSEYDLRPGDHTLNFSDYCEEAGWKLVDAKQKFCIFKQVRPDAVPIVTPDERLKNASKAYRKQLIWQTVLSVLMISNMLLRFLPTSQLIDTLFSGVFLVFSVFWLFYFLHNAVNWIWFASWLRKAKKCCRRGETKLLSQSKNIRKTWVSIIALLGLAAGIAASAEYWLLLFMLGAILIIGIPFLLMAKYRPNKEANIGIQIVIPIVFSVILSPIIVICIMAGFKINSPTPDAFPLMYEDLEISAGEVEDTFHTSSSSIFGSTSYYSLHYENSSLSYEVYETEYSWLLNIIWDHYLTYARNAEPIDCTEQWGADAAYSNNTGEYYVHIGNAIFILDTHADFDLSETQIAVIRAALCSEG